MSKIAMGLAAVVVAAIAVYRLVLGPWEEHWAATDGEARSPLPGDDLVAEPATQVTRAITVDAPPGDVWPWLVQLGADRGGFYSYDWLENLFRLGIHSADTVVPEWQLRTEGDLVFANRTGTGGWYVMESIPNEALVLKTANVKKGRPTTREEGLEFLWTFALRGADDGTTRLLVRERTAVGKPAMKVLMAPVGHVSFVMSQKMLRGIKARAESTSSAASVAGRRA